MTVPNSQKPAFNSDSVTGVLKRIIAENGRDHIWGYVFAITCLIVVALSSAYPFWVMKSIINELFVNRRADLIFIICASVFLAFVLRGFASYGQTVILSKIGNSIVASYQRKLFAHLMKLPVSFFNDARSARISAQISQNISGIRDTMNLIITLTARDLIQLLAYIGVMLYNDYILTLFVFFVAPVLLYSLRIVSKKMRTATSDAVHINSHVLGAMQETIQGVSIVKAFTMEKELERKLDGLITSAEQRANRIARLSERTAPLTESFAGLAIAGVIAYASYQTIYQNVPPGAFFAFIATLLAAYDPARRLARLPVQLERAVANARMIYELLDMEPHQRDITGAKDLIVSKACVEFRHVDFGYTNEDRVLSDVSFVAEGGTTTALVGPSGAGKSTIISLMPRFYDPHQGEILIDGQDISQISKQSLRQHLAYVSQQPYLFEGTIRDNIRYGRPEASDADVEEAARLAYAHDFIVAQPKGYDTPVGENGMTLSGGQRQRISIARALVRNAPILILDEATSALDTESEAAVQKALDHAMKGRTVIVIAHRLSTIVNADKIIVMQQGRVMEEGTHETLAKRDNGLYARLNNLQKPSIQDAYSS